MGPSCKKSLLDLEVENQNRDASMSMETGRLRNVHYVQKIMSNNVENITGESADNVNLNTKTVPKPRTMGLKRKMSSVNEVLEMLKVRREIIPEENANGSQEKGVGGGKR